MNPKPTPIYPNFNQSRPFHLGSRWLGGALAAALLLTVFATNVAYGTVTGGGWIPGATSGKATFGVDVADNGTGSFTYHDISFRSADFPKGLNIHGTIDEVFPIGLGLIEALGTYTAEQRGTSGYFLAVFGDSGATGAQKGDVLEVSLYSDPAMNTLLYDNTGFLGNGKGGGNITVAGASPAALSVFAALLVAWAIRRRRLVLASR